MPEINKKNYNKEKSIQNGENKFHMINEEVEEDFEELEKRHLEFLNEIEKIKFK